MFFFLLISQVVEFVKGCLNHVIHSWNMWHCHNQNIRKEPSTSCTLVDGFDTSSN